MFQSKRELVVVVVASIMAQVGGNVAFQWSLGVVGLALAVPFTLATLLIGSTVLAHWLLKEHVTRQTLLALTVVTAAVCVLSLGAPAASKSIQATTEQSRVALGILVVSVAGFFYSVLGAAIRWSRAQGTPMPGILFASGMVGVLLLGSISLVSPGWEAIRQTTPRDMNQMVLAGVFNAIAFAALVTAMHVSGLVYVNTLNASQTAMASVAGVMFFGEALTWPLVLGVLLTGVGLMMMQDRGAARAAAHEIERDKLANAAAQNPDAPNPDTPNPDTQKPDADGMRAGCEGDGDGTTGPAEAVTRA